MELVSFLLFPVPGTVELLHGVGFFLTFPNFRDSRVAPWSSFLFYFPQFQGQWSCSMELVSFLLFPLPGTVQLLPVVGFFFTFPNSRDSRVAPWSWFLFYFSQFQGQ